MRQYLLILPGQSKESPALLPFSWCQSNDAPSGNVYTAQMKTQKLRSSLMSQDLDLSMPTSPARGLHCQPLLG